MALSDHWYKNAVIYGVDIDRFQDTDGDGSGDMRGLIARLDYLRWLGVDCLWILPFFPSPNRDNGYDISDHYGVEPRLGTPGEFVELLREAESRGIRVIIDLVVNHTSDQHPWFQQARRDRESRYHEYYIWTDAPPEDAPAPIVFSEPGQTVWEKDEESGDYYYHTFYPFMPDLNFASAAVQQEVLEILGFWLQLGVAGFRVDAAPHMIEPKGPARLDDPHGLLRRIGSFVRLRQGDAALLGESDVEPQEIARFFESGEGLNMLFNFLLDNYLFLAFAREEAGPIRHALDLLPERPDDAQWANFLRNLDELDLERLTESERQEVYAAFAPEKRMRIYGRGIRRRLAPMFKGDQRRLRMAYSLLFSLPGTPALVYGDEIGMGDLLSLPERESVRTPMQWSAGRNAGFSGADPEKLTRPLIDEGEFAFERVNVEAQRRDPESMLHWMRSLIALRRETPEVGWGKYNVLDSGESTVLAHRYDWRGETVVIAHNLGREPRRIRLDLELPPEELREVFADREYPRPRGKHVTLELEPYGFRWLRRGDGPVERD